ncbi:MAG: hypothetical protein ABI613_02760 [Gemmatimonadota bacterium]
MTTLQRLNRVRVLLSLALVTFAITWGLVAGSSVLLLAVLVDALGALPLAARQIISVASVIVGFGVMLLILHRSRTVLSRESVALWLEDRLPELRYALVTLVDERYALSRSRLDSSIAGISWTSSVARRLFGSAVFPLTACAGSLALLLSLPSHSLGRIRTPHIGDILERGPDTRPDADPFATIVATISPPPYTHLPAHTIENPETLKGVVGSVVQIEGRGDTAGLTGRLGDRVLERMTRADHWFLNLAMPDSASGIWLERLPHRRLIVLEPIPDSVPAVELLGPARDSVLRDPGGRLGLDARVHDDFGLRDAWFEYIVSTGEGENFTFRSGEVGRTHFANDADGTIASQLALESLKLVPGNIVHLRAVARDGNSTTGPGVGYSETRTIRILRAGEGDSIAIDAAAPAEGDSSLLSERMLILTTEALVRQRTRLARDSFVEVSRTIGGDQATLRKRVADIIFLRLGAEAPGEESEDTAAAPLTPDAMLAAAQQATTVNGEALDFSTDESPVVALNKPLLEAYNAMWDAGRSLEIGEARQALPHMRAALEAIQRARQAERLYLRGRPTATVVDVNRVRLAGKRADAGSSRVGQRPTEERTIERLVSRFTTAIDLLPTSAGVDSLSLLRIDALSLAPDFAGALGDAIADLRGGRDATSQLIRARRLLARPAESRPGISSWDVIP